MNVTDFLISGSGWWVLPCSLLALGATFGLLPGLVLRLVVLLYPKGHPRREELYGELYADGVGRVERFEMVFQMLEVALRQGPKERRQRRLERRRETPSDDDGSPDEVASPEASDVHAPGRSGAPVLSWSPRHQHEPDARIIAAIESTDARLIYRHIVTQHKKHPASEQYVVVPMHGEQDRAIPLEDWLRVYGDIPPRNADGPDEII